MLCLLILMQCNINRLWDIQQVRLHYQNLSHHHCTKTVTQNRQNEDLNDKCQLNEGRKLCRMLALEHSAILLTCIKQ